MKHDAWHVLLAAGTTIGGVSQERMARVLQSRRQVGGLQGFAAKALGLESKMRQYEVGERFLIAIEGEAGPRAVDPAWRGPEFLPTLTELAHPAEWLARVT